MEAPENVAGEAVDIAMQFAERVRHFHIVARVQEMFKILMR
jgi:hypothetical protein